MLGTVLCSGLAAPALAQSAEGLPRPAVHSYPDSYGVDLATGRLNVAVTDISVGSGDVGLSHKRYWLGSNLWRDEYDITAIETSKGLSVSTGGATRTFSPSSGKYVSDAGDGAWIERQNYLYVLTESDGTVTTFGSYDYRDGDRATEIRRASGEKISLAYENGTYVDRVNGQEIDYEISRLSSVSSELIETEESIW